MLTSQFRVFAREVPLLILGTWQFGGAYQFGGKPDGLGQMDPGLGHALIERAYDGGVRVFDTADIYGLGAVESLLASLPSDAFVVTKFGNRGDELTRGKDFGRPYLVQCLRRSSERLERVPDLVLMHNPALDFDFTELDSLDLEQLRQDGLLKGFGVSCTTVAQAEVALESPSVQAVEVNFNLLDPRAQDTVFSRADELGKDVLLRAPYCSGFLTRRFLGSNHQFLANDRRSTLSESDRAWRIAAVRTLAAELQADDIEEIALRYCLSFSRFVVFGCHTPAQLEANLDVARKGSLDASTLQRIAEIDIGRNPVW